MFDIHSQAQTSVDIMSTFDHDMDNLSWRTVAEADIFLVLVYFYFNIFLCNFLFFFFFCGEEGVGSFFVQIKFQNASICSI